MYLLKREKEEIELKEWIGLLMFWYCLQGNTRENVYSFAMEFGGGGYLR